LVGRTISESAQNGDPHETVVVLQLRGAADDELARIGVEILAEANEPTWFTDGFASGSARCR
jgi:hypothetical protein